MVAKKYCDQKCLGSKATASRKASAARLYCLALKCSSPIKNHSRGVVALPLFAKSIAFWLASGSEFFKYCPIFKWKSLSMGNNPFAFSKWALAPAKSFSSNAVSAKITNNSPKRERMLPRSSSRKYLSKTGSGFSRAASRFTKANALATLSRIVFRNLPISTPTWFTCENNAASCALLKSATSLSVAKC